jgi:hypothetical protein
VAAALALLVPAPASGEYLGIRNLSDAHERTAPPRVAVNARGEGYAVWNQDEEYRVVGRGLFDSAPNQIETLSGPLNGTPAPDVALSRSGRALVFWRGNDRLEARFRSSNGEMGEIFEVAEGYGIPMEVALDSLGNAVFIWQAREREVYTRRLVAGIGFGPVTRITPPEDQVAAVAASVSASGRIVVVWSRFTYTEVQVRGREVNPAGVLGPVVDVTDTATGDVFAYKQPRVTMNDHGDAFVTWSALETREHRPLGRHWPAGGELGGTEELESGGYPSGTNGPLGVRAAMNDHGEVFAVWEYMDDSYGKAIHGRLRHADGSFGSVESFTSDGRYAVPEVGLDDSGRAIVAWAVGEPLGVAARRRRADGTQTPVASAGRNGISGLPMPFAMASSCAGHAIMVWGNPWEDGQSIHAGFFNDYVTSTTPCARDPLPPSPSPPLDPPPAEPPDGGPAEPPDSGPAQPPDEGAAGPPDDAAEPSEEGPTEPPPADPAEPPTQRVDPPSADTVEPPATVEPATELPAPLGPLDEILGLPAAPGELEPAAGVRLRSVRVTKSRVRLERSGALPRSFAVRFELDRPALIRVDLDRASTSSGSCAPSSCRWRRASSGKLTTTAAGSRRVALTTVLRRGQLTPGRYRALITADAGGGRVASAAVRFRVLSAR